MERGGVGGFEHFSDGFFLEFDAAEHVVALVLVGVEGINEDSEKGIGLALLQRGAM